MVASFYLYLQINSGTYKLIQNVFINDIKTINLFIFSPSHFFNNQTFIFLLSLFNYFCKDKNYCIRQISAYTAFKLIFMIFIFYNFPVNN